MLEKKTQSKPTLWQVLISVMGALLGVQSSKVRERDFVGGRQWWVYVIVGIVVVILIVLVLITLIKYIVFAGKQSL
jgi:uncharacterized membrane protein YidH (DUF202 family)